MTTGQSSAVEPLVTDNGSPAAPSQPAPDAAARQKLMALSTTISAIVSGLLAAFIALIAAPTVLFLGLQVIATQSPDEDWATEALGFISLGLGLLAAPLASILALLMGAGVGVVAAPVFMSSLFAPASPIASRPSTRGHAMAIGLGVGGLAGLLTGLVVGLIVGVPFPVMMFLDGLG